MRDKTSSDFMIEINGISYDSREDAGVALIAVSKDIPVKQPTTIGSFRRFEVQIEKYYMTEPIIILKGNTSYPFESGGSTSGNLIRMENVISGLEKRVERVMGEIVECERNMEQSREEFGKPFSYEFQLKSKLNRQMEINSALDIGDDKGEDIHDKQQNVAAAR